MLRRLHSRIIGLGSVCGMTRSSPPSEVFLKSLPPPKEINPQRYERFKNEEETRSNKGRTDHILPFEKSPETFYEFMGGAAGHKHVVLLLSDGNIVTFGDNTHGQTGAPKSDKIHFLTGSKADEAQAPLYIDLGETMSHSSIPRSSMRTVCGSNFSFIYLRGGRRVIAFGNNHVGQLAVGHKNMISSERGFEVWDPLAPWWPGSSVGIDSITCGFNHSVVRLTDGSMYSFGSNTWGELAIGSTTSPMHPTRIDYFQKRNIHVKKIAMGNSITLFLTHEGKVYGCGATDEGQLPSNSFEPVIIPVARHFVRHGDDTAVSQRSVDPTKLIKIKDIACAGSAVVYLTTKNELLVQGGLRDYGFSVRSPRFRALQHDVAVSYFVHHGYEKEAVVEELQSGPQTVLLRYQNGCIGGFGSNSEGELSWTIQRFHGREVNVAPSFSFKALFPVFAPVTNDFATYAKPWFVMGKGFSLAVDVDSIFPLRNEGAPIELPFGTVDAGSNTLRRKLKESLQQHSK